jgi:hypothetical protein
MPKGLRVERVRRVRWYEGNAAWASMGLALGLVVAAFVWAHGLDERARLEHENMQAGMDVAAQIAADCDMLRQRGKVFIQPWFRGPFKGEAGS